MQMRVKELRFLPEDEFLPEYEKSVLTIAKRRVVKLLFSHNEPLSISEVLVSAKISLNSLAAIYLELSEHGYIKRSDAGLLLTHPGRLWALKYRKSVFMHKQVVTYKKRKDIAISPTKKVEKNKQLPKNYLFSWIDIKNSPR